MTPLARALLGVALGSCLTLFIHPMSRPYLTGFIPRPGLGDIVVRASGHETGDMAKPRSVAEAGLWMQLGCEKLVDGKSLTTDELKSLVALSQYMETWGDPSQAENAFWPQMAAVFLDQLGDKTGARKSWESASKCLWWKDYQATRLLDTADKMREPDGPMAWHLAALYYQRQFAVGPAVLAYAKKALDATGQERPEDVQFRFESLTNAHLMAAGAQSIEILKYAGAIAELSFEPPNSIPITVKSSKEKARGRFYQALVDMGKADEADTAKDIYNEIDSRPVLTLAGRPEDTAARWSAFSIITATLPGALLIVAIVGGLAWPAGLLAARFANDHKAFSWPPALVFGGVLGVGVFSLTVLPLAAIVALLASLFLVFTPKNERTKYPNDLGPFFAWTVGLLAVLFLIAIAGLVAGLSTPGHILLPSILKQPPSTVGNRSVLALGGVAAILFALLLLVAPMWAFGRRVRTPFVLGCAFQVFGKTLVAVGLAGVILLGPLSVYADSKARGTLFQLVGNEPEYYYNIFQ